MGFNDYFIDVKALPDNEYGLVQVLFLGLVYGYFLMYGSNLISDGSELLLLVPSLKGLVGSIVLPILGAVPDGCIVLFSGFGPNAQGLEQSSLPCIFLIFPLCRTNFCWYRSFGRFHHYASYHSLVLKRCWRSSEHRP